MTTPADAFDVEFYRSDTEAKTRWRWDIYAAGTAIRYAASGESRFRLVAYLRMRWAVRKLLRTVDSDIAFLPVRKERAS